VIRGIATTTTTTTTTTIVLTRCVFWE